MARSARPPFADWPQHFADSRFGFGWVVRTPRMIITQAWIDTATVEVVHTMHDWFDQLVSCGFVHADRPVTLLHDLRTIRHMSRGVRETWLKRAKRPGDPFRNAEGYVAAGFGPLGRVTANTIALAMQLASSQSLHFVDGPESVLNDLAVSVPDADLYRRVLAAGDS